MVSWGLGLELSLRFLWKCKNGRYVPVYCRGRFVSVLCRHSRHCLDPCRNMRFIVQTKLNTAYRGELNLDELDLTAAESKATYDKIKAYVLEKHGLKVSSLDISQVKRKSSHLNVEANAARQFSS